MFLTFLFFIEGVRPLHPILGVTSFSTSDTDLKPSTMSQKIKFLIRCTVLFILLAGSPSYAQTSMNASSISGMDVQSLSDNQIQTLLQQASAQGMSVDQAIQIAKSKGASQAQIDRLMKRINTSQKATTTTSGDKNQKKEYSNVLYNYAEEYSQKVDIVLTEKLKRIFGHQLFNSKNLTFEPSVSIALPKDYVLGVDDELIINVSGASQQNYQLTVDRNGSIFIPNVGPVSVLGMEFEEARKLIKKRLTSIFHGMSGSNPNTWADVSVSSLRSIKVNVIGEAMAPGSYTLPATASAFNALFLSGGPNENGSFRNIRVVRDNKVLKVIDVYDYLLNSDASSNVSLRDQDIIYIPTYDNRVDAEGAFKRPGLYELKMGETMQDLFKYSGGFNTEAYKGSVNVTRMNGVHKSMVDVKASDFASFELETGDSITAGEVLDRFENRVTITGAVFRPGSYAMTQGMKVSDLINQAQGLREDVFSNRGLIVRLGKDLSPTNVAFSVSDVMNGRGDVELQREDSVFIQDIFKMREKRYVRIYGEVQNPGEYEFKDQMSIRDLIFISGGLKEAASESFIEISRRHNYDLAAQKSSNVVKLFQLSVPRNLQLAAEDQKFILEPFDYIYIRKAPSYFEQKTVTIEGEVLYPGPYSIQSKNERISDLIKRCGGLTAYAYIQGATLFRETEEKALQQDTAILSDLGIDTLGTRTAQQLYNGRVELRLEKIMKNPNSPYNYHLKDGDRIIIPEISEEVRVAGAILNPVGLTYEPRRRANYYIDRAGGFDDNANSNRVYVINSDGTTQVTKSFIFKSYPMVLPGSKIIVPQKEARQRTEVSTWLAIASTFSSLAIAIVAVLK
jgi:protein involved in polysaccharide export with SLBB domain